MKKFPVILHNTFGSLQSWGDGLGQKFLRDAEGVTFWHLPRNCHVVVIWILIGSVISLHCLRCLKLGMYKQLIL